VDTASGTPFGPLSRPTAGDAAAAKGGGAGGGSDGRKAETQAQILAAAAALFARKGFDRTTVAAIAAQAGVSRAAVFWHFGDKATLFQEACRRLLAPFIEELRAEIAPLPARERISQLFDAHERFTHEHRATIERFVGWAVESPTLRAAVGPPLMFLHETFARELGEAVEEIVGDPARAEALAAGFLSLLDGNLLLELVRPDARALRRRREGLRLLARDALGS